MTVTTVTDMTTVTPASDNADTSHNSAYITLYQYRSYPYRYQYSYYTSLHILIGKCTQCHTPRHVLLAPTLYPYKLFKYTCQKKQANALARGTPTRRALSLMLRVRPALRSPAGLVRLLQASSRFLVALAATSI